MVLNQGLSAASRILPIIDQKNKIKDNLQMQKILKIKNSEIKFKMFIFHMNLKKKNIKNQLILNFEGGKMTSLVGHSGSGKSTILNLIPRFYDAQSGDIKIDNQSIYKTTIKSLRKEISMVSQETTLFDDTIKNNIKYANENATDEEILK